MAPHHERPNHLDQERADKEIRQEIAPQIYRPISGLKGHLVLVSMQEIMLWRRSIAVLMGSMYFYLFAIRSADRLNFPQHWHAHPSHRAPDPAVKAVSPNATAATVGSTDVNLFAKSSAVGLTFPQRLRTHRSYSRLRTRTFRLAGSQPRALTDVNLSEASRERLLDFQQPHQLLHHQRSPSEPGRHPPGAAGHGHRQPLLETQQSTFQLQLVSVAAAATVAAVAGLTKTQALHTTTD